MKTKNEAIDIEIISLMPFIFSKRLVTFKEMSRSQQLHRTQNPGRKSKTILKIPEKAEYFNTYKTYRQAQFLKKLNILIIEWF